MYSIDAVLSAIAAHPGALLAYFAAVPALTLLIGLPLRRLSARAAAGFATVPTYLAALQGVSMLLVLAYSVLILHHSLLALNALVYYLPIASAAVTLAASAWVAPFAEQPGYNRLSGLCLIAALAFGIFFVIDRLHFFVGVFVPLAALGGLFLVLSALFRVGGRRLRGERADLSSELERLKTKQRP